MGRKRIFDFSPDTCPSLPATNVATSDIRSGLAQGLPICECCTELTRGDRGRHRLLQEQKSMLFDGRSAQLDQAHLLGQLDHLHEQVAQLRQVQRAEVADRAVLGKLPAPSIRNVRSSCNLRSILRELNTPVA